MTQKRIFDYHAPNSTEYLNNKWVGIIASGVYSGFHVSKNGKISPGILLTEDGVRISEDWPVNVAVPVNDSEYNRIDLIICKHEYIKTVPAPSALYEIITGIPALNPEVPDLPENSIKLATGFINPGASEYSEIIQSGIPDQVINARFAVKNWRIIKGELSTFRKTYDVNNGEISLYIVPPGRYQDGEIIDWGSSVLTLNEYGALQINDLAGQGWTTENVKQNADSIKQEIQIREELVTHLMTALAVEEAERKNNILSVQEQLKQAKGTGEWNDLPSSSIENLNNRVSNIESQGGIGLPNHNTRHEINGEDEIRFDNLRDGNNFIKMHIEERERLQSAYHHSNNNNIHISKLQKNQLVNELNCSIHHHDSKYYSKSHIDNAISGKANKYHNHDSRYLHHLDFFTEVYAPGENRLITTLGAAPDHMAISYNYLADDGMPDQPTYAMGERTKEISCKILKVGDGWDKDYEVYIRNRSAYTLWINIDIFQID